MRHEDLPRQCNVASRFLDRAPGERTALVSAAGRTSYAELAGLANRAGNALRRLGVRRRDRVLLALRDSVELVATWYGVQKIGAVTAEVHAYLPPEEYRYYLDYAQPAMVVADGVTVDRLRRAGARDLLVAGVARHRLRAGEHHFDSLVAGAPDQLAPAPTAPDDPAIWKFTTGSTGAPKACVLPARSPLLSFEWYGRGVLDLRPDDLVLPVPKLFFGYARDLAALFPFGVGAAGVVFPERSTPERVFELIATHRPTVLVNVPTMIASMVEHPDAARQDLSCLRLCTSAGEALPPQLHRRWLDAFGVELVDGIGSSEAYHIYLSNRPGQCRPGSLGRAVPGYRVRVVDRNGTTLPAGAVGLLEVTGATVALGYWRAPGKSAETFPAAHTVRSGDLFTQDSEGYFYYQGRADDLLKVSGRWVAPVEVENCLLTHPSVAECAVTGQQVGGLTRTRAFVVTSAPVSAGQLREFAQARLPGYKCPHEIELVDRLPRTATGKLDRRALAAASPPVPGAAGRDGGARAKMRAPVAPGEPG